MTISKAFGLTIKVKRVELGLKQEELAFRSDMARSFLSGIERGVVKASIDSVWKLSRALDCYPSDLWAATEKVIQHHEEPQSEK